MRICNTDSNVTKFQAAITRQGVEGLDFLESQVIEQQKRNAL